MRFQYYPMSSYMGEIDIQDESSFAIECVNDKFEIYYLIVTTETGVATIFKYGPTTLDSGIGNYCECSITKMNWDDVKIPKLITKFINDNKMKITQITEVDKITALNNCVGLIDFMKGECTNEERDN